MYQRLWISVDMVNLTCYLKRYTLKKAVKKETKKVHFREKYMTYTWAERDLEWISVVTAARTDGLPVCGLLASPDRNSNSCCRWLKFEEDVEDGGERWSKPYVATLSLHSLFELRCCIINSTVLLDMRASTIEEIAGNDLNSVFKKFYFLGKFVTIFNV